jgi:TorA maturation chaperone TorD
MIDPATELARECVYRFLATAVSDPNRRDWPDGMTPANRSLAAGALELLRHDAMASGAPAVPGESPPEALTLAPMLEELDRPIPAMQAEFDRVFGLTPARECPPYETDYFTGGEPFFISQQLADIAGFYRAFGLQLPASAPGRPDHLETELSFMAFLLMKQRIAHDNGDDELVTICQETQRSFFRDHLSWWVPAFASGLWHRAEYGFYAHLGRFLAAWVTVERRRLMVTPSRISLGPAMVERNEDEPECAGCQ